MAFPSRNRANYIKASVVAVGDRAWVWVAVGMVALMLILTTSQEAAAGGRQWQLVEKPCDEIYVVGEGETLHTISDKCSDPYIVERNPHIHDPDDVFPGLVIKIVPLITL